MIISKLEDDNNKKRIYSFLISNGSGSSIKITNFGATIMSIKMPDKNGRLDELVMGYDNIQKYYANPYYFGATIGRVANRIAGGEFQLNGKRYKVACNEKDINLLHSGDAGLHYQVFESECLSARNAVNFYYRSPDGESGFPGNVDINITMTLTEDNIVRIEYKAKSDEDTFLNLTNHTYFNLRGAGSILDHELEIDAGCYTPVDENLIPTGDFESVIGTPFDFRVLRKIGEALDDNFEQINITHGYDHSYVITGQGFRRAAEVVDRQFGRRMSIYTDMPCMQFYTANFIPDTIRRGSFAYGPMKAYCFETQFPPDAMNKRAFPSCLLKQNERYNHSTEYRFGL